LPKIGQRVHTIDFRPWQIEKYVTSIIDKYDIRCNKEKEEKDLEEKKKN